MRGCVVMRTELVTQVGASGPHLAEQRKVGVGRVCALSGEEENGHGIRPAAPAC